MLLSPYNRDRPYPDESSAEIMRKTIGFLETTGLWHMMKRPAPEE